MSGKAETLNVKSRMQLFVGRAQPHALPGAARPSGCNGRDRESEREDYLLALMGVAAESR